MSYGYPENQACGIKISFNGLLGRDIILISASGMDDLTVSEILDSAGSSAYHDVIDKIIMFIGFSDEEISKCIEAFPGDIPRPIFCLLTEENIAWTAGRLLEHLKKERDLWKNGRET
jgi:hypothetical protein